MRSRIRALLERLFGRSSHDEGPPPGWAATDRYISESLGLDDRDTQAAIAAMDAGGLPQITVSANQGKLLELLGRMVGARRILELGTLGGYSTIWLARSLPPDGRVVTIEYEPRFAEVARASIAAAGYAEQVDVRIGAALDVLPQLDDGEPFDLIFIDADKIGYPAYVEWALRLSRPGTLIVVDNVVGGGAIAAPDGPEPWGVEGGVAAVRRVYELLGADPRVQATAIQTVGDHGHDGFALALVTGPPPGA
jgi:predicted O-methyltransferase YrrM